MALLAESWSDIFAYGRPYRIVPAPIMAVKLAKHVGIPDLPTNPSPQGQEKGMEPLLAF